MASKNNAVTETPRGVSIRVGKLDSLLDVRRELGRLYRSARRASGPEPDAQTAAKLGYLLSLVGRTVEGAEFEKRLQLLEERLRVGG